MTLSPEEYHDHLKTTAVRAGFSFDEVVLPEERRVAVNGLRFRYLDWGTEGKRPILFLHGGALTAHTWDLCCLALRDDFHCMALDQRGHGDSDWAPDADYSIAAQREDVKGFAETHRARPLRAGRHVDGGDQRARLRDRLSRDPVGAGADRRRPRRQAARLEPHPRFRQWRRQAGIARRDHRARARLQPAARSEGPAPQPDAQSAPSGGRQLGLEIRPPAVSADGRERTPPSAQGSPTGSPRSPARPWWCAAPKATSSTRRTPSAWRSVCPTAAASRSPRPATPCRATTQKIWSPHCAIFSADAARQFVPSLLSPRLVPLTFSEHYRRPNLSFLRSARRTKPSFPRCNSI